MANRHEDAYQRNLADWRKTDFVTGIDIRTTPYSCVLCHRLAGCYRLADAPPLPQACEIAWGCTAWWTSIMNGETPRSAWRTQDTSVDRDAIGLAVSIRQCCLQIQDSVETLIKPRIRASTRQWRTQALQEDLATLQSLDPQNPLIEIGRKCLVRVSAVRCH